MTVEEIRGSLGSENRNSDKFPVGMRVLAVDDDPTCLMLLDGLLRKCQYLVTTTSQAKTALKMLRENRNRFDLVISDVHMPDMDGFKLLELVGLEMDLPVIMLSANGDSKLVMKGITHGACDYLVKPVRIEELRNIWQHVIRRKKFDPKHQNKCTSEDKARQGSGEGGQGPPLTGNLDQNGRSNRKRKDEEDESEDNGHENEDPSTQKKPRVVWSIELHRKFVAAVNQLGIEKAVPKRILDLMNTEGLTRENVASHLQKYRIYLKRMSSVASQQANMVAALGGKDSSYMRIGSLDGLGDFRTLSGSGRLPNTALSSYPASGMLGRFNTPAAVSLRSLTSSALIQPSHAQNFSNSINTLEKFQPLVSPDNQNTSSFQGIPSSLELDQLQQNNRTTGIQEFNSINNPTNFVAANTLTNTRIAVGSSSNSLPSASNNPLMLQGNSQQIQSGGGFGDQSYINMASFASGPSDIGVSGSSNFRDHGRYNENWQNGIQLSKFPPNSLPLNEAFNHNQLSDRLRENASTSGPHIQNRPLDFSSTCTVSAPLEDSRGEMQSQAGLVGDIVQNMNRASNQRWEEHKQDYTYNSNHIFSSSKSMVPSSAVVGHLSQSLDRNNCSRKMDASFVGLSNSSTSTLMQHCEVEKSTMGSKMRLNQDYLVDQTKSQGAFVPQSYDSLDVLMNAMIKRRTMLMDGEFGYDAYSFGSSI
ncbi:two-component response regulator ORR24-like isoform X2 [Cornus florida]|uniref:two-component response regulator ORR24-like isoform X2 n=1 Tax=Cornus florida TaxID=4283 RepID=UPI0028A16E2D|nr:two-component response regulator ORR24-like isoform X2 [Cornus florida]